MQSGGGAEMEWNTSRLLWSGGGLSGDGGGGGKVGLMEVYCVGDL